MKGMKKFFVALPALLVLMALGSGTALAQFCAVDGESEDVRAEGIYEEVGEITIECPDSDTLDQNDMVTISIEMSNGVEITNLLDADDETVSVDDLPTVTVSVEGADQGAITVSDAKVDGEELEFQITLPMAVAEDEELVIAITGVKVNASAAGGNEITADVDVKEFILLGDDNVDVADPLEALTAKVQVGPVAGLQCAAPPNLTKTLADLADSTAKVRVTEGFAGSLTSAEVLLEFDDIPDGVDVYLPISVQGGDCVDGMELTLKGGKPVSNDPAHGASQARRLVDQVSLSGGSGSAAYDVAEPGDATNADDARCDIPVIFQWSYDEDEDTGVAVGSGTVSAGVGPVSNVIQTDDADVDRPRFVSNNALTAAVVIETELCSTTLLFPFVTNQSGFDTGVVISNTSDDAFGTTKQNGACTVYYYGSTEGDGADPAEQTSGSIGSGEQLVFLVSSGSVDGSIAPALGFQGYLMVRCDFQFGHGLAFLTDGFGIGAPTLAQSYLALVVPVKTGDRSVAADGFEELNN